MDGNDISPQQSQNNNSSGQNVQSGGNSLPSPSPQSPQQPSSVGQSITPQISQQQQMQNPFSAPPLDQSPQTGNIPPQPVETPRPTSAQQSSLQGTFTPSSSATPVVKSVPNPSSVVAPTDVASDGPKITIQDLYGPSQLSTPPDVSPQQNPSTESMPQPVMQAASQAQPQEVFPPAQEKGPSMPEVTPFVREPIPEVRQPLSASPSSVVLSVPSQKSSSNEKMTGQGSGGFRLPPIMLKLVGGLFVLVIILFLASFVFSFFNHTPSSGKVTLTYWGLWEDNNVMQGVIADFERQNPNITINYSKEDPTNYTDRLLTRIQNGTGPDIFRFHNSWVAPLQNVLLPIPSTVIDTKQLQDNYFPAVSTDLIKGGAIYGVPLETDNLVLYTNKTIFDHAGAKVPVTWEDFVTVAKGLTVKDAAGHIKTAGAALGTYNNISHAPDILSLLFVQNGADLHKLDGSQNTIDALNFYTSFAKTDDRVWDNTLDNSLLAFSRGNLAMYFGYSYDYFAIKAASPQLSFEVHAVPHLPGRDMSIASYWVEGISNTSKHQKEALLFLKYLTQKDVMTKLYTEEAKTRQFGELYPRKDLASSLSTDPILATFIDQAGRAVSSIFVSDTNFDGFNGALNQYLGNAVNSLLSDTSADSAVATLAQGVSQVFNKYANTSSQ